MSATSEDADIAPSALEPNGIEMAQYETTDSKKSTTITLCINKDNPCPASLNPSDAETSLPLKIEHPKYYKRKKALEAVIFIGGIVILWTLLALDIVAYHIPPGSDEAQMQTVMPTTLPPLQTCSAEVYNGSVCLASLQFWQSCIPDRADSTEIFIPNRATLPQEVIENQFVEFLGMLSTLNPSVECQAAALPFYCLLNFGLCGNDSQPYLPTTQQCEDLMQTCEAEFQIIGLARPDLVPNCAELPDTGIDCTGQNPSPSSNISSPDTDPSLSNSTPPARQCSKGFFLDISGFCMPECGEWEELPHGVVVTHDVIVGLQAIFYLVVATIALICSGIQYERMFKFPSILVVYGMIPVGIFEIILLISFTDRKKLFCNSRNLVSVLTGTDAITGNDVNSTPFCVFSGVAFYYLFLQQTIIWLCHIISVVWGVVFPFHFQQCQREGYFRSVHLGMIAVVLVFPVIPVIVASTTGGYSIPRFPPNTCLASDRNATFYGFIVLIIILLGVGICLIILVFWRLTFLLRGRKMQRRRTRKEVRTRRKVETKVLVIVSYFFLFLVETQVAFTFALREAPQFRSALEDYFMCEALGVTNMTSCNRSMFFNRTAGQSAIVLGYVILGFYPVVNLVYVINIKDIKRKMLRWLGRANEGYVTEPASQN